METIEYKISKRDFQKLNRKYRRRGKSSEIGKRAVDIVKIYFKDNNQNVHFSPESIEGIDLIAIIGNQRIKIEIKGTAEKGIARSKLGVSGKKSHDYLENGMPLYRIANVYGRIVKIFILKYGEDFKMDKEDRWKIKKIV